MEILLSVCGPGTKTLLTHLIMLHFGMLSLKQPRLKFASHVMEAALPGILAKIVTPHF